MVRYNFMVKFTLILLEERVKLKEQIMKINFWELVMYYFLLRNGLLTLHNLIVI